MKQASVSVNRNGKHVVRVRDWGRGSGKAGRFLKWGLVEEFHEPGKIMVDIDDKKNMLNLRKSDHIDSRRRKLIGISSVRRLWIRGISIQSLAHTIGLSVQWIRWDRTRHGWHIVIKVRQKLTLAETIAAQAILGSDPARERLNLARCISLRKRPSKYWEARANILYSRKAEHG
ncbi:MAG: hypothetical protein M0022_00700 [Desulfobacteraceae bacterium]|nr:hypothetical protein [Desulfobacteraceae bacterium]